MTGSSEPRASTTVTVSLPGYSSATRALISAASASGKNVSMVVKLNGVGVYSPSQTAPHLRMYPSHSENLHM